MSFLTGNEFGLSDVATDHIVDGVKKVPLEWLNLSEEELREICYPASSRSEKISSTNKKRVDDRLRASFWIEYSAAIEQKRKMVARKIYHGIVHEGTFNLIVKEPTRLVWILQPPGNYAADMQSLLSLVHSRYLEIMNIPITEKICRCHWECKCSPDQTPSCYCKSEKGCICPPKYNTKAADIIAKVAAQIELRTQGSIPQYINQKTLNVNVNKNQELPANQQTTATLVNTREELLALREQHEALLSGQAPTQKEVIDVEK